MQSFINAHTYFIATASSKLRKEYYFSLIQPCADLEIPVLINFTIKLYEIQGKLVLSQFMLKSSAGCAPQYRHLSTFPLSTNIRFG